jgi:hypothetical protein
VSMNPSIDELGEGAYSGMVAAALP